MNCPNCERDVIDIVPQGTEWKPDDYHGFCHIGSKQNNGRVVYVYH